MADLESEIKSLRRSVRLLTIGLLAVGSHAVVFSLQDSEPVGMEDGVLTAKEIRLIDDRSDIAMRLLPWHIIIDVKERLEAVEYGRVTTSEQGVSGLLIRDKNGMSIGLRTANYGDLSFQALDFWDKNAGDEDHGLALQVWHFEDEAPGQVEVKFHSSKQAMEEVGTKATIDGKVIQVN